jgi:hypothetical protein
MQLARRLCALGLHSYAFLVTLRGTPDKVDE